MAEAETLYGNVSAAVGGVPAPFAGHLAAVPQYANQLHTEVSSIARQAETVYKGSTNPHKREQYASEALNAAAPVAAQVTANLALSSGAAKLASDTLHATSKQADNLAEQISMGASANLGLVQTLTNLTSIVDSVAQREPQEPQGAANPAVVPQAVGAMQTMVQNAATVSEKVSQASDMLHKAGKSHAGF